MKNKIKFSLVVFDLALKFTNDSIAASDMIICTNIRLKNDSVHSFVLVRLVKVLDDFGNVAYAKQLMGIEELSLAIVREIRGENAVRSALPTLVFAGSTSLGGGAVANSWDAAAGHIVKLLLLFDG